MAASRTSEVMQYLRGIARAGRFAGLTDGQLLGRFVEDGDAAAFAALVRSLGPLVWGVCRRLLPQEQDAEDAFQATFLILARKAASLKPRDGVANWLHGVARRAALQARRAAARRRTREALRTRMPERAAPSTGVEADLRERLDEELSRLPERDRRVILLCDLAGRTRREAARELGWPEGTVAGRLARARALLRSRLVRRGLGPSLGALAMERTCVPAPVLASTMNCTTGAAPAPVAALVREVLAVMVRAKQLKAGAVLLVALACCGVCCRFAPGREKADAPQDEPASAAPAEEKPADGIAWGKEVNGLQAGLVLRDAHPYRPGETVQMEVKLRNVGRAPVTITYGRPQESAPRITDAGGKNVDVVMPPFLDIIVIPTEQVIQPGKTLTLYNPEVALTAAGKPVGPEVGTPTVGLPPGKYKIAYEFMLQSHPALATGAVEVEVKDAAPAPAGVEWGKPVDGLQAGVQVVGTKPIHVGDKVRLAVKLRNVGATVIKTSAWPLWMSPPSVVDAGGKPVPADMPPVPDFEIIPSQITLQPGQTISCDWTEIAVAEFLTEIQARVIQRPDVELFTIHARPGRYKARFAGFLQDRPSVETGAAAFDVTAPE